MRFDNDTKLFEDGFLMLDYSSALPQVPMIESDLRLEMLIFSLKGKASCANNSIKSFFSIFEKTVFSLDIEDSVAKIVRWQKPCGCFAIKTSRNPENEFY